VRFQKDFIAFADIHVPHSKTNTASFEPKKVYPSLLAAFTFGLAVTSSQGTGGRRLGVKMLRRSYCRGALKSEGRRVVCAHSCEAGTASYCESILQEQLSCSAESWEVLRDISFDDCLPQLLMTVSAKKPLKKEKYTKPAGRTRNVRVAPMALNGGRFLPFICV